MPRPQPDPNTALLAAIAAVNPGAVARQLAAGADPNTVDDEHVPALLLAIDSFNLAIVTRLLDAGALVETVDPVLQESALACAAKLGLLPIVELLIARGADVNRRNPNNDDNPILVTLLDPNEVSVPDPAVIAAMIRAGADVEAANNLGWTPLLLAASFADPRPLALLLAAGADPRRTRGPGIHPVDVAEAKGHDHHIWPLISAGGPTPGDTATTRIRSVWQRIDACFAAHAPKLHADFLASRGASLNQIASIEHTLGLRLPADVRAHLRQHGGTNRLTFREYGAMSAPRMLERWQGLESLRRKGTFKSFKPHELSKAADQVRWTWWHRGWLPFAEDGGGNLYCIDIDPATRGRRGQVIGWEIHGGPVGPHAPSFDVFLDDYAEQLEAGDLSFLPLVE